MLCNAPSYWVLNNGLVSLLSQVTVVQCPVILSAEQRFSVVNNAQSKNKPDYVDRTI